MFCLYITYQKSVGSFYSWKTHSYMKENVVSIVIALLLATWIFFVLRLGFGTSLQNNIIWVEQKQLMGDVIVETYKDKISLVSNKDIPWIAAISVMSFFDHEVATLSVEKANSVWDLQILDNSTWRVSLFINQISWLQKWDEILSVPVSWEASKVTISDVVFQFEDNSSERASVSMR